MCDELVPIMHGARHQHVHAVRSAGGQRHLRLPPPYPSLGIMGGLDKNALATKKETNIELPKTESMLADGGIIPGFDHLIPPDVSWENWKYAMENLKRILGA